MSADQRAEGGNGALTEIIAQHVKGYRSPSDETWDRSPICSWCGFAWPCDTAIVSNALKTRDSEA